MLMAQFCWPMVFAQPAAQVHAYVNAAIVESVVESKHVAPFWHMPDEHSFTSTEQSSLPLLLVNPLTQTQP
jgi:hypothetical protein